MAEKVGKRVGKNVGRKVGKKSRKMSGKKSGRKSPKKSVKESGKTSVKESGYTPLNYAKCFDSKMALSTCTVTSSRAEKNRCMTFADCRLQTAKFQVSQKMVSSSEPSVNQTLDLRSINHFRISGYDSLD